MATEAAVRVPFVDLAPTTAAVADDVLEELALVIASGDFVNGPAVGDFEASFAAYCGTAQCVGVASGLDALRIALAATGVGRGDEVIVPAATFIATFAAVAQVGATPVPVDVSEEDYTLDPGRAANAATSRTTCIVPVHLYGQLADMHALTALARSRGIAVVEDAAQAHGAARQSIRPGTASAAAAFSFYPGKNLGAFGDAGAVITNDAALAQTARALRQHGEVEKYRSTRVGWTARLDTVQAVVLRHKLRLLDEWNADRRRAAAAYSELLDGVGDLRLPQSAAGSKHVWHLYVVRTQDPAALGAHLGGCGVATGRHYPEPPHLSAAFADLGHGPGAFPIAEALASEGLSLPMFPGITEEQLEKVAQAIRNYFERG
jgi:dTDP-4-amino-4,6-dideoxygalactose transaminase